jgi:hypothetical protein
MYGVERRNTDEGALLKARLDPSITRVTITYTVASPGTLLTFTGTTTGYSSIPAGAEFELHPVITNSLEHIINLGTVIYTTETISESVIVFTIFPCQITLPDNEVSSFNSQLTATSLSALPTSSLTTPSLTTTSSASATPSSSPSLTAPKTSSSPTETTHSAPSRTSSTSTPSPTNHPAGITSGAKAGIAIGTIAVIGVAVVLIWFCLRRRRRSQSYNQAERVELATAANTQELEAKERHEAEAREIAKHGQMKYDPYPAGADELYQEPHELPHDSTRITDVAEADSYYPHMANSPPLAAADSTHLPEKRSSIPQGWHSPNSTVLSGTTSISETGAGSSTREVERSTSKLEILKARLERVRNEKERLNKLQELEELEKELKEEVMAESRRAMERGE